MIKRMKGIVLDIDEQGAIVIDNEGKYTKIKHNDQLVTGVLVEYTEKDVIGLDKKPILSFIREKGKFIYPAACAAILVLVIGMFGIVTNKSVNSTFAYIDVDINPSIELEVNEDECIIGVNTLNKDAEKLCENIDFIGKKAESGVVDIINKSSEMGYFHDDKKIVMVAGALNVNSKLASDKYEKLNNKMGGLIEKIKNKVNSGKEDVELVAFHTSPFNLKEAQKNNISLGRYSLYANADNERIKLALDDAKELKISELLNLLPEKDFTYFEEVQRQAAIDFIKEEGKDKNKEASSKENKKNDKAHQNSNNKGLNKSKHNIGTSKPDDEEMKNTPEPSATTQPSKNPNKDEATKNNDNRETSNKNESNHDTNSTTDVEKTSTSEKNNERSDNTNNNNTNNNNTNNGNTNNNNSSNSNTVEKDAQNNNASQNNGQSNNSSNHSLTESNNNNGKDNGKSHGNKNKKTTSDIQSTPTPIVEANNTATSIVHPTTVQTPEVTQNTPVPVQTPAPVTIETSAIVDNTNKNNNSKNDSAPGQVKKETKTENENQNKNKNR